MVYRGIVKDGVVVMETGVTFEEGTVVEVQAAERSAQVAVTEYNWIGLPDASRAEEIDRLLSSLRPASRAAMRSQQKLDAVL